MRALEWLLGTALRAGAEGVLTVGPWGSHHATATATFAALAGLRCRLVLFPQPPGPEIQEARRRLPGLARCSFGGWPSFPLRWLMARLTRDGSRRPFSIPAGASSPVGVLGVAEGALEVAHAVRVGAIPAPQDVLVPAGSCGTAAGLMLGFALSDLDVRVVAVRVTPRLVGRPSRVRSLAQGGAQLITMAGGPSPSAYPELVWIDDLAGRGYGHPTQGARDAIAAVGSTVGLDLETTYTGKALSHPLMGRMADRRVLFRNTLTA